KMSDKKSNLGFILFFFVLFVSLLAWITYGNIDSVFGMLMYLIIGICAIFIWIIPIVGFVIGIIFSGYLYVSTLNIAQITPALLPFIWFCFNSFIGISYNVVFTILLIQRFKFRFPKNIKNIALINCNIIDGLRNSDIIEGGVILIENKLKEGKEGKKTGLIKAVGTANDIEIPEDYEKIDLKGQWVLPGLINSHCHLMGSGKPMKAMKMTSLPDETLHKLFKILNIPLIRMLLLYMMHGSTLTALNSGVTTLRSLGEVPFLDVKLRKKIEKRKVIGPRLLVAGIAIAPTGGHGGFSGIVADSSAEIRKIVRKNLRNDVDCLKIMSTGGVMDAKKLDEAGKPQMTVEEIEIACIEAHRGGILVGSHVESTQGVLEALLGGVDTIEHGAEMTDEIVELYKNNPKSLRGYSALSTTIASGMGMGTLPPEVTQISAMSYANTKGVSRGEIKSL
ncbi:MAG: amidohydrolase family protein, partial [archaeon]|nr:amidohydrolase family protein [archaeon]